MTDVRISLAIGDSRIDIEESNRDTPIQLGVDFHKSMDRYAESTTSLLATALTRACAAANISINEVADIALGRISNPEGK